MMYDTFPVVTSLDKLTKKDVNQGLGAKVYPLTLVEYLVTNPSPRNLHIIISPLVSVLKWKIRIGRDITKPISCLSHENKT